MARDIHVNIRFADDELKRMENMIGALGNEQARVGLARAVNRVTDTVRTRVIRAVAKQSSLPQKVVRKRVKAQKAAHKGTSEISGMVYSTGSPLSLYYFGAKQFSWGVRAKVWGSFQRFPGTFIWAGTWKSGKAVANEHVFARTTKDSLPIERQDGASIPEEMVKGESVRVYEQTVRDMLPARAMHELSRLLNA